MDRSYGPGYWDKKYFWDAACWSCGVHVDFSVEARKMVFELSRQNCPIGCPEEGDLICLQAFIAGGCNKEMEAKCLLELEEDYPSSLEMCPPESGGVCDNCHSYPCQEQLDSLDAAIAAGPDDV